MLEDHQIAALIILCISGCGMCANWFITIFIRRLKSLQNPFGRLTNSQAIGEALHQTIFTFYFVPMVFFDVKWMKEHSRHTGMVLLMCYDICIYSHFFISLNRMCAIFLPLKYNQIFGYRNTTTAIVITWIFAIFPALYLYLYLDCQLYYEDTFYDFAFITTPTCLTIAWYADFMKYVSFIIVICVIDIITVCKVHFVNISACLQACVFVCELLTYFVLAGYFSNKWVKFLLSTCAWNFVHSIDGIITLGFNKEFRTIIPCFKSQTTIIAPTERYGTSKEPNTPQTAEASAYSSGKPETYTSDTS